MSRMCSPRVLQGLCVSVADECGHADTLSGQSAPVVRTRMSGNPLKRPQVAGALRKAHVTQTDERRSRAVRL
jgi:hypothetical protein